MSVRVNALDHIVINVADVARSVDWYRKVLGMRSGSIPATANRR